MVGILDVGERILVSFFLSGTANWISFYVQYMHGLAGDKLT